MDSWTKGGREREIPIVTAEQRALLDEAKRFAGSGSLIPKGMNYRAQLNRFKSECQRAGIRHVHGHRHEYAQRRYAQLTGWACPARGGPTSRELTPEQKENDRQARLTLSAELGHSRIAVVAQYCGH
jgi:integrase